jgi:chitinase
MLAGIVLAGLSYGSFFGLQWFKAVQRDTSYKPWFAAYVDVTATPTYTFEQQGSLATKNVVLAFIVASPSDSCTPTWGGYFTLDEASEKLDLDRRIARLQQLDGSVAISFGGLLHDELAVSCADPEKLLQAYETVVNRYHIDTIDLDLENNGLTNTEASKRRATVIAKLQAKRHASGKNLAVWLTLPVSPQGLATDGTSAISSMLSSGVDVAGINIMTMDYSNSRQKDQSMLDAAKSALMQTHRQLDILYKQVGLNVNSATLWRKIGATPMIGQNDIAGEIFTITDANGFNEFARTQGIGRLSMWSANRDIPCGENYVDVHVVSDACSGVKQEKKGFTQALSKGFTGKLINNISVIKAENLVTKAQQVDDPAKSPYQIWNDQGVYLKDTKVVWHKNVYQAKWWNQNDSPDNPVLQSWETPWQLLGPVLPGEKPVPLPTLPEGTYPNWSGNAEYEAGKRILFNGVAYQAKWWTKGDSPAATSNNDTSPWVPLSPAKIKEILERL